MRVLHIISGDLWAGAESMALDLISTQYRDPAIDVMVAIMNKGRLERELSALTIPVIQCDEKSLSDLAIFIKLLGVCRGWRPDIIHTHRTKENILGSIASLVCRACSLRTVHGWSESPETSVSFRLRTLGWLDRFSGKHLQNKVVAVSDELGSKLWPIFGKDHVSVVSNGIDITRVRNITTSQKKTDPAPTFLSIGIVARLVPVKRHDKFISAAEIILAEQPGHFRFHIVGDGPEAERIMERITKSPYADDFNFHGHRNDSQHIISQLDAVVFCSDHEGLPMTALEAAVLNTPIISTPLPSIIDLLKSGVIGRISSDGSPNALAKIIMEQHSRKTSNSKSHDKNWKYSSEKMADQYRMIYQSFVF